jgi:GMP synthase-like glutamine amidotransferase
MRVHWLQHVEFEGIGAIGEWAEENGHELACTRLYDGETPPEVDRYDWLVVMGGPMNVDDEAGYPWLAGEKRAIRSAIDSGRIVVGVCLGAQLIARVLGVAVRANEHKEIGWYPVTLTDEGCRHPLSGGLPTRFDAFHWHGETFDLPDGAVHLASSEACANQMFAWGDRVLALQCHLEMTAEGVAAIVRNCRDELTAGTFIQNAEELAPSQSRLHDTRAHLHSLLDRLPLHTGPGG